MTSVNEDTPHRRARKRPRIRRWNAILVICLWLEVDDKADKETIGTS